MINGIIDNSAVRSIKAKVELFNNSATLINTYTYTDDLQSIEVERLGDESKFFGFGVCQKVNIKLRDINREIAAAAGDYFKIYFASGDSDYIKYYPLMYITEVHRDENTNQLSITAYDKLYSAKEYTIGNIDLDSYYITDLISRISSFLNIDILVKGIPTEDSSFELYYESGANLEGTEDLRSILNYIAEATQTIYYINSMDSLVFRRLSAENTDLLITKNDYFTLESKTNRRLVGLANVTELGDNVEAKLEMSGTIQYIRDNPFLELREDIAEILETALGFVGGFTINQFNLSWRGNYLLEIGDRVEIIDKDGGSIYSYVINDTLTYSGGLAEATSWNYTDSTETANNPTNLGEALNKTFARVDKANKQIDLVASETSANKSAISALEVNTSSINASVSAIEQKTEDELNATRSSLAELTNKVSAQMTAEQVKLEIETELANGVNKVTTATGFTFNENGLNISKSDSAINTQITENGMQVFKDNGAVLTANNEGVNAVNLKASTYLIIGNNSRIEDYGSNRSGCFWIGG